MLRLACCLTTERKIAVCAPVHDALLVEAPEPDIDAVVQQTRDAMTEAARKVLGGVEVDTDATVVRWPNRYADRRGVAMWSHVTQLLAGLTGTQI